VLFFALQLNAYGQKTPNFTHAVSPMQLHPCQAFLFSIDSTDSIVQLVFMPHLFSTYSAPAATAFDVSSQPTFYRD